MNLGVTCPLAKPSKESARNCTRGLLSRVMSKDARSETDLSGDVAYSAADIESAIYDVYPSRDTYLSKIAKVALHLSVYTRTGRVSWTFQNAIFNRGQTSIEGKASSETQKFGQDDYLEWLLTRAADEDVFPELYRSHGYITELDRQNFETHMHIEHDAILRGLHEIVRQCCDSGVCNLKEMGERYDAELFKIGSIFETAARSVCSARKIDFWIPPGRDIAIPDTTPIFPSKSALSSSPQLSPSSLKAVSSSQDRYLSPVQSSPSSLKPNSLGLETREPVWKSFVPSSPTPLSPSSAGSPPVISESLISMDRARSVYTSQDSEPDVNRNFGVTGQVTCFDVSNLIHNLAVLEPGKLLELPWDGSLLDGELQNELYSRFRVEIGMRRYFLAQYYR
jgi:hypothetical protein